MLEFIVIGLIGFFVSIISGILGLGGAVVLIPAYLYLPQMFGLPPLGVKEISGLTSIQVFASSFLGVIIHRKKGSVASSLLYTIGIPMAVSALLGALMSHFVNGRFILIVFAVMALIGAVLMFTKSKGNDEEISSDQVKFNKPLALTIAIIVGTFGGMVGAPGAFLLAPLMITILRIPTRVTIGSTLGIILFTSLSASAGKIIAGQVNFLITFYAVFGSLIGVAIGSNLSYLFKPKFLRLTLAVLIIGIALQMMYRFLF